LCDNILFGLQSEISILCGQGKYMTMIDHNTELSSLVM